VANPDRAEVREMLYGAIGCNLAWGIVDAVMYVLASVMIRGRGLRVLKSVQSALDPAEAPSRHCGRSSNPFLAARLRPASLEMVREDLVAVRDAPPRPYVARGDLQGAVEVFLLVFLSTFPVVVPFMLMNDARLALRTSNAVAWRC
jgi:hypothetical protein